MENSSVIRFGIDGFTEILSNFSRINVECGNELHSVHMVLPKSNVKKTWDQFIVLSILIVVNPLYKR